jgi:hypothetical protein
MRIAQITDLHLRHHLPGTAHIPRRKSRLMPDLLRRAVERLRAERPDVVILSGDLLDYPLDRMEDPETLPLGRADLVLVRDILEGLDCPRLVLPGNHDPEPLVAEVFASPLEIDVAGHRVLTFVDREGPGNVPGRTGESLSRFHRVLDDGESPPQVHVQHYLIWPVPGEQDWPYVYGEAEALREAIVGSGRVCLVLSGHYHPGITPRRLGDTWFATPPSFAEAPHALWVYDLDDRGFCWRALEMETGVQG